ncbi:hypothetical protein [Paenisporosarcina sp. OV554]|uniref:hypothetical protein n=1 Tax=Paenisporosarcina sp. OV554 TaxID=2135694 RepID=UPI000D3774C2|nr:hypothetical protein [Paenisporosarcina sp. OV554]PUB09925.1 hypothetical protein C8K15_12329 [Paenisporosarcina sp. OV554]
MEIEYNITEEDYIKFNLYHIKHSKTGVQALRFQRYLPPASIIAMSLLMTIIFDSSLIVMLTMSLLMSIPWLIFFPEYFKNSVKQNVKKMLREGDNNGMIGSQHLIMKKEGIIVISQFGETKVSWADLKTIKKMKTIYIFMLER